MPARAAVKKKTKTTRRSKGRSQATPKGQRRGAGTSSADLKKFRDILLAEQERLELELQEIESRTAQRGVLLRRPAGGSCLSDLRAGEGSGNR